MADFDFDIIDDDIEFGDATQMSKADDAFTPKESVEVTFDDKSTDTTTNKEPKTEAKESPDAAPDGDDKSADSDGKEATADEPEVELFADEDTFQKLSENLLQMGIFGLDEGEEKLEVKTPEAFTERWQKSYQSAAENYIQNTVGQYGKAYADAFQKIFIQGLDPYEYFTRSQQIEQIETTELEGNEAAQERIYTEFLRRTGIPEEKIATKVQKLKDFGELESEAEDAKDWLIRRQEEELQQAATQRQAQIESERQAATHYQQTLGATLQEALKKKELDGIPVTTQKRAEEAVSFLTEPRYTYNGQTITELDRLMIELRNPKNAALAAKVALLAIDGFKTDKVARKAVSDKADKLFTNLTNKEKIKARTEAPASQDFFPFA